jgi:hypothetical protein
MDSAKILAAIDAEIEKLQQVRDLLQEVKGSKTSVERKSVPGAKASRKTVKRSMSPEARKRVAEAQKKRWAVAKKSRAKGGSTGDGGYGITGGGTGDGGYGITPKGGK